MAQVTKQQLPSCWRDEYLVTAHSRRLSASVVLTWCWGPAGSLKSHWTSVHVGGLKKLGSESSEGCDSDRSRGRSRGSNGGNELARKHKDDGEQPKAFPWSLLLSSCYQKVPLTFTVRLLVSDDLIKRPSSQMCPYCAQYISQLMLDLAKLPVKIKHQVWGRCLGTYAWYCMEIALSMPIAVSFLNHMLHWEICIRGCLLTYVTVLNWCLSS